MTSDDSSSNDDAQYRVSRLAVYRLPVAADVRRALAIEDAVSAVERASAAVMDASVGEPDDTRTKALRQTYVDLRLALADLKRLAS
jgi:beta-phosphoglucomutase-like phosphatase (HAD superfamily)